MFEQLYFNFISIRSNFAFPCAVACLCSLILFIIVLILMYKNHRKHWGFKLVILGIISMFFAVSVYLPIIPVTIGLSSMIYQNCHVNFELLDPIKYEQLLKKALKISIIPIQRAELYSTLADNSQANLELDKAIKYYEKSFACTKKKYYFKLHATAPLAYITKEDYDKAIEIMEECYPNSSKLGLLTEIYIFKREYDKALEIVNKTPLTASNVSYSYITLAVIYKNQGKSDLANNYYKKALKIVKNDVKKQQYYKKMYEDIKSYYQGHWEKARKNFGIRG